MLGLTLNGVRQRKLTSTLLVSNAKIKAALGLGEEDRLPLSAREGLRKTLGSF